MVCDQVEIAHTYVCIDYYAKESHFDIFQSIFFSYLIKKTIDLKKKKKMAM